MFKSKVSLINSNIVAVDKFTSDDLFIKQAINVWKLVVNLKYTYQVSIENKSTIFICHRKIHHENEMWKFPYLDSRFQKLLLHSLKCINHLKMVTYETEQIYINPQLCIRFIYLGKN